MGLRESRIKGEVHPWFGARLQWMEDVAKLYGGRQLLISGNRTEGEQRHLYNQSRSRPAAYPGCSQHQYGLAADAVWQPFQGITSKGKGFTYTQEETDRIMNSAARYASLHLVTNDTGHMQVFNGLQFKEAVVSLGLCNPNPPDPDWFPKTREDHCNFAGGAWSCGKSGCQCYNPYS